VALVEGAWNEGGTGGGQGVAAGCGMPCRLSGWLCVSSVWKLETNEKCQKGGQWKESLQGRANDASTHVPTQWCCTKI